jgi:hypothetical protein
MRAVFGIIFLLVLLVACAEKPAAIPALDGDTGPAVEQDDTTPPQAAAEVKPAEDKEDPAVLALFSKQPQVKSYSFDVAVLPDRSSSHQYFVKGDKVKIEPVTQLSFSGQPLEVVYLDRTAKTATGYCVRSGTCKNLEGMPLDYDEWNIVLPQEWIGQIKYGEKTGTLTFFNKQVTRVRYQADGKYYEAYVDNYYGMPQRVAIASNPEMKTIVGGYEYRNMAFNMLEDSDVVFTPRS